MIISSEITGKTYKTVDDCLADEKKFLEKQEAEKKARKEHEAKKQAAYEEAIAACEKYLDLCGIDIEFTDHGYKATFLSDDKADKIFEDILNAMLS